MNGSGDGGRTLDEPAARLITFVAAIGATGAGWPLVHRIIPITDRFAIADLVREHWTHRHALEPWLDLRWAWLALHNYHLWFAVATLPGGLAAAFIHCVGRRTIWPLVVAPIGWLCGSALGYWLYTAVRSASWALAVMMPAVLGFLGGVIAARLSALSPEIKHLRGTRMGMTASSRSGILRSWLSDGVALAGVPLSREDETMHVAAIGATGSGKSTALRALMAGAIRRGDRHVVADPDGSAMRAFFQPGDVILNPFDRRCARWDLLSEIERPGDHAFLAQAILPHLGNGDHDQWVTYAQQLLAAALENFQKLALGTTADLIAVLASGSVAELKLLCQGTAAARFFEPGGERMLASILGTLAPAIGNLRIIAALDGAPFSIRQWVRSGAGSLWLPYSANQIAALRALISSWMSIAILETLSLTPDATRRIWFHIDELDALGRIEGLKDAQARLRKFGGCAAIGFQSFAQVKAVYGEGANTIIENCGNLLLLRSGLSEGGGTAELAADLIGSREVERDDVSRSRTRGRYPSQSATTQRKRAIEDVTLASEITQLRNREGFVKRATRPGWRRVRFPYQSYPTRTPSFDG